MLHLTANAANGSVHGLQNGKAPDCNAWPLVNKARLKLNNDAPPRSFFLLPKLTQPEPDRRGLAITDQFNRGVPTDGVPPPLLA